MPSSLPERFFLGGNSSPVCTFGGPTTLLGFKSRGLGPTERRRLIRDKSNGENSETSGRDVIGGDLAVTAFADLSFDLPLKLFRDAGIHGHVFACAGNLTKLTENEFRKFSFQKFLDSFRSSAGFGIIVPTKLFRMEVSHLFWDLYIKLNKNNALILLVGSKCRPSHCTCRVLEHLFSKASNFLSGRFVTALLILDHGVCFEAICESLSLCYVWFQESTKERKKC